MVRSEKKASQIGRPRNEAAVSHAAIMDAVYELVKERPARDVTIEAVARRANVGKPTIYKWWPSKASLILAMFHERLVTKLEAPQTFTAEEAMRFRMQQLITEFNGLFGKVVADLIAEGQANPAVLEDFYEKHVKLRRASTIDTIERGKASGEFLPDTKPDLLLDAIFAPVYYRLLLRYAPLTQEYGSDLIEQGLRGVRAPSPAAKAKPTSPRRA